MHNKRIKLIQKQGYACKYCDEPFTNANPATVDHIKPVSKGGTNAIENLAAVHATCNSLKGSIYYEEEVHKVLDRLQSKVMRGKPLERLKQQIEFWARLEAKGIISFKETVDWSKYSTVIKPNVLPRGEMVKALKELERDRKAQEKVNLAQMPGYQRHRVPLTKTYKPAPRRKFLVSPMKITQEYINQVRSWGRGFSRLFSE